MDDIEDDPIIAMGVSANLARLHSEDQREFAETLARMLAAVLPDHVLVERQGGLFAEKRARRIKLQLNDDLFALDIPGRGPLIGTISKIVRGIKLRTESPPIGEWLDRLIAELDSYAGRNLSAREALKRFVEGNHEL